MEHGHFLLKPLRRPLGMFRGGLAPMVVACFFLSLGQNISWGQERVDRRDVLKMFRDTMGRIRTVRAEFEETAVPEKEGGWFPEDRSYEWVWAEPREYLRWRKQDVVNGRKRTRVTELSFDGGRTYVRDGFLKGEAPYSGRTQKGKSFTQRVQQTPRNFLCQIHDFMLLEDFLKRPDVEVVDARDTEKGHAVLLQGKKGIAGNIIWTEVWMNVDKGCLPEEIRTYRVDKGKPFTKARFVTLEWQAVDAGNGELVHFPTKGVRYSYNADTGAPMHATTTEVTRLEINKPVDEGFFRMGFEPGAYNWDTDPGMLLHPSGGTGDGCPTDFKEMEPDEGKVVGR